MSRFALLDEIGGSLRGDAVAKHLPGKHDQKDHGRKGGGDAPTPERTGITIEAGGTMQYGDLTIDNIYGIDVARKAGRRFGYWGDNWATRVVSARMMGLEGGYEPRGYGDLDKGEMAVIQTGRLTRGQSPGDAIPMIRNGAALLQASTHTTRSDTQIHRGLKMKPDDPRYSAKPGDEFEMPLSAFTDSLHVATGFADGYVGSARGESEDLDRALVLLTVGYGHHSHPTGNDMGAGGEEIITQGRFRVVEVRDIPRFHYTGEQRAPIRNFRLQQVAYYNPALGKWVDVEPGPNDGEFGSWPDDDI